MSHPDLYRSGNTTSPRFDNVREGTDIPVVNGLVSPNTGGISTFSQKQASWTDNRTWILRRTVSLGTQLVARNDRGQHWSIEPKQEMTLTAYKSQLQQLNTKAVRYDQQATSDVQTEATELALPRQSSHSDKATRFIFNALASVVHNHIPVPKVPDWDENDYSYLAVLAQSLEDGSLPLSDLVWDPEDVLKKEKVFTAAAVSAYMTKEENARKGKGNENDEADLDNDHALLRTVLKFDDAKNPLAEKYA
ncbi:uncharacterized protein FOMMEDRAFT_31092 [Fomitiporia mediterranea MF3/22]|uniref:uncharacterized protein n=1 Tax=Fomitiporia mediterranea (strain MF3/22) TaxID=694068 RepID=UPI00044074DB|nr:uncharacterized protein FOMMEDRAFT_31092 [Fomitiporia mediterranea MF3/22]EJC99841.1 hypothetical protein FOMMEDRAFT_31092 [Fomitiporia mediterranea MF3/22]